MTQEEIRLKQDLMQSRSLDELCRSLLSTLEKEADVWRELRETIVSERQTIKMHSLEALRGISARKETIVWKLKMLEEVRAGYIKKIGKNLGIPENRVNLTALSSAADGDYREEFRSCREKMGLLLKEIRELNQGNQDLLDVSASLLRGTIDFIQDLAARNPVYQHSGKLTSAGRYGRIVQTKG